MSNSLDPDQAPQLVLIWVRTVCKGSHQTTKVATNMEKIAFMIWTGFAQDEKYLNIQDCHCLENSSKIKFALKSTC